MVYYILAILEKVVDCPVTQGRGTEDKKLIFFSRSLLPVLAKKDYFLVSILILVWLILPQAVTWADPSAVSTFHCI